MAARVKKENSIENDEVIKLKLETASIVENIVKNLDAKISTSRDFKILTDSILQREAMIRHLQYILAKKPKLVDQEQETFHADFQVHQAQQTLPEDFPIINPEIDDSIDTTPNQKDISTQTFKNIDNAFTQTNPEEPRTLKNIDTSSQTDEDQVVLANLKKISNLEISQSKMEHNQDLLLAELHFQKENCLSLQDKVTMMNKKLAEVTFANNLYHVSLVEQNCSLPDDAEELLASLSSGGQAEDLHSSPITMSNKKQDATFPFQKVQVDNKISKKDQQASNQLPEDYNLATLFTMEDPIQSSEKKANKTLTKELAWITKMSQVLTKLEKKFSIPLEKRKPRMFRRKTKINHIIPKPFRTLFHLLAAPEPDPITVPEPYPVVDWANVRLKPTLPHPVAYPVLSASKDPEVYQMKEGLYKKTEPSKFSSSEEPFGTLPGYRTTEGVVQVPRNPTQGYIYCLKARKWLLHASLNPVGGRPGGRGCPGTRRGEKERGKKPHSLL